MPGNRSDMGTLFEWRRLRYRAQGSVYREVSLIEAGAAGNVALWEYFLSHSDYCKITNHSKNPLAVCMVNMTLAKHACSFP